MLGIVSDSEFELEIDRLNGDTSKSAEVRDLVKGRGNSPGVPEVIQKIIGESAIVDGNKATQVLARALGVSDSSMSAYKNGATSTASYDSPKASLKNHTDLVKESIIAKSHSRLRLAIKNITKEKLEGTDARKLAGIARDLSGVIKNLEPERKEETNDKPFIIYAPQFSDERSFQVVQAKE